MNRNFLKTFTGLAALFIILILADASYAQRRARNWSYSKAQVEQVIARVEDRVDTFGGRFDNALDNSRLNNTLREDQLNRRAKDLETATDELRRDFNRRDRWIENKDEVRRCLNIATDIDQVMRNRRFDRTTERKWANVRYELNTLAKVYNLPTVGSRAY